MGRRRMAIAVLVSLLGLSLFGCSEEAEVITETAISVSTESVRLHDIAATKSYSSIARGENEAQVMSKVAARVTSVAVVPGQAVRAGQTIMTLDSSDYQGSIAQAQAGLDAALAGQRYNQLNLENAQKNYDRMLELHTAGAISDMELEGAKTQMDALQTGSAEASIAQARAGVQAASDMLRNCNITSPIDGIVGSVNLSVGDTASPAMPVAVITTTDKLEVSVMIAENDIRYVQPGDAVTIKVRSLDNAEYEGVIKSVATVADTINKTYEVKAGFANSDNLVKSGMFVEVTLGTEQKSDTLAVPINAVMQQAGRDIVYVVNSDNRAQMVEVETGLKDQQYIEIVAGLSEGQEVVTKGNTLITNGALLNVVTAEDK